MSFKHNKKRNVALVYEFLLREMSEKVIEEDKKGFQNAFLIFKKYFSPGCVLQKKKELFDVIRENRGVSCDIARQILGEVSLKAKNIDNRISDIKESNLIKDINYGLGRDFFAKHRIPEYRLLATIQLIVEGCKPNTTLFEDVKRIQLKESLVKFMSSNKIREQTFSPVKVDKLVYTLAENKFKEKYGKTLSDSQKRIMAKYIKCSFNVEHSDFRNSLISELSSIKSVLQKSCSLKEVKDDVIMQGKMNDAMSHIDSLNENVNIDELVEEVMLYQKLVEELASNE